MRKLLGLNLCDHMETTLKLERRLVSVVCLAHEDEILTLKKHLTLGNIKVLYFTKTKLYLYNFSFYKNFPYLGKWGCANLYLQLRAKQNCEGRSSDRVEGFLKAPLVATFWLMSDHGAQLRWKAGPLGVNPNPPCQHSLWEETGVPGENPRSQRWKALVLTCAINLAKATE